MGWFLLQVHVLTGGCRCITSFAEVSRHSPKRASFVQSQDGVPSCCRNLRVGESIKYYDGGKDTLKSPTLRSASSAWRFGSDVAVATPLHWFLQVFPLERQRGLEREKKKAALSSFHRNGHTRGPHSSKAQGLTPLRESTVWCVHLARDHPSTRPKRLG